jgi:O-antigen ligase
LFKKVTRSRIDRLIATVYVIAITFVLHALDLGQVGTVVVIPIGFIYFFLSKTGRIASIVSSKPMFWYIIFFLYSSFSILYSIDRDMAIKTQSKMFIVLLFSIAVFTYALNSIKTVKACFVANVIVLFSLALYVLRSGVSYDISDRLHNGILNANAYGYFVFTGLSGLFMLYTLGQNKRQKVLYMILILVGSISSISLILASASRGASIIAGLLIVGNIFVIVTAGKTGMFKKMIVSVIFGLVLFNVGNYVNNKFLKESYLLTRFDSLEERETPREFHVRKALEIGWENPLLGVGSGNYAVVPKKIEQGSFSHNTFTEVFANFGFIGLLLYFSILSNIGFKMIKNLKMNNNRMKVLNYQILLFFLLFLVYNGLYIVYLTPLFMHFLFVVYALTVIIGRTENPLSNNELL